MNFKKFFRHMVNCVRIYRLGYFYSELLDPNDGDGFIRLNFENKDEKSFAICDLDFAKQVYSHLHKEMNETIHRWDSKASK